MLREAEKQRLQDATSVAARFLDTAEDKVTSVCENARPGDADVVRLELLRQLEPLDPATVRGATVSDPTTWTTVEFGAERVRVPDYVSIPFPAGTAGPAPLFVRAWPKQNGMQFHVHVHARSDDEEHAAAYLADLLAAGRGERSPYYHRVVEAFYGQFGLAFRLVELDAGDRSSLVLAPHVWEAVVRNVDRMFERMDRLAAAGLGTNRGLVLSGPPGTGKSALCRVLAQEYQGQATVTIVSASAGQHLLGEVYERMNDLGPALVLVEDLDLLIGDREDRQREALVHYLTVLDGLMTRHSRVVTVATTNDAELIDAAAIRAARFDQVVALPLPDEEQRSAIFSLYLAAVDNTADVALLAQAAGGFSGADIREVVRGAVLDAEDHVVAHDDLERAVTRRRDALEVPAVGFGR
jgi:hypothetical protein